MKTSDDPRHQIRLTAVQELFAWDAQQNLKSSGEGKTPKETLNPKTKEVLEKLTEIDKIIQQCAPEWETSKINQIDLAILRLAIFELIFDGTEPFKVILDEAVEIAKEFGTETSPAFINGALGKALLLPVRIKKIVALKFGADDEKITDTDNLISDLNGTDLEISDLLTQFEKEYNITIAADTKIETVADLIETIQEHVE